MKTIKEILGLAVENIERFHDEDKTNGICDTIVGLQEEGIISSFDEKIMVEWLRYNLPEKVCGSRNLYCWPEGEMTVRINWMLEKIKELS